MDKIWVTGNFECSFQIQPIVSSPLVAVENLSIHIHSTCALVDGIGGYPIFQCACRKTQFKSGTDWISTESPVNQWRGLLLHCPIDVVVIIPGRADHCTDFSRI